MKSKLIYLMVFLLGTIACGGRNAARGSAQQHYETVDEGSAAGVTSTIQGPGETLPSITGTNADTTTNFALNPNALPPPQAQPMAQPTTGGTYPPPQAFPPMTSASASPAPQPAVPASQPQPAEPEPAADTTATTPPPPATTTTVAPEKPQDEEPPPPPEDDTSGEQGEEPSPPPPQA